jgi:hypothetical protein
MSLGSILLTIFAIIGIIIIATIFLYWLYKNYKQLEKARTIEKINPPGQYMQNSGIKCPDYWVNTSVDSRGNYVCKNSFNVESINPKTGSNAGKCNPNELVFPPVESGYTWDYYSANGLTPYTGSDRYNFLNKKANPNSLTRCDWINNCGPSPNIQGIWSGVNQICNNPQVFQDS